MSEYIHHVSGRLRLKLEHIKRQPLQAQAVDAAVRRIRGVTSVNTNVTTGSLLIRYDTDKVGIEAILHSMKEAGLLPASRASQSSPSLSIPVADKVADIVVGKLIERSAVALLGALF